MNKGIIKALLQIFISLLLFFFVIRKVDFPNMAQLCAGISLKLFVFGIVFSFITITIVASRLQKLLKYLYHVDISIKESLKIYLYGCFYSNVLPSSIGGDGIRAYYINKYVGRLKYSIATVIIERIVGFTVSLLFAATSGALIAIHFGYLKINLHNFRVMLFILLITLIIACVVIFFISSIYQDIINKCRDVFLKFKVKPSSILIILFITIVAQTCDIIVAYIFGRAANLLMPIIFFFLLIPLLYIITSIPISINGIGLREIATVHILGIIGIDSNWALLLSFMIYFDKVVKGLLGGGMVIYNRLKHSVNFVKVNK